MKKKTKTNNLIKNTIILLLGKFCTQFVSFLLLPLYTSKLSTVDYGFTDLITTYVILLVPIVTLQIEMFIFRFLIDARDNEKEKTRIITNSYFLVILLTLICVFVLLVVANLLKIENRIYLFLVLIATIASNITLQTSRGLGNNKAYSLACIIIAIANILISIVMLGIYNLGIYAVFFSIIFSNLFGTIYLFFSNKIYKYISMTEINRKYFPTIVKYSLPLVPNGLVWWIINSSDKTIISIIIGLGANGVYTISNKFSNIINSIYGIFNMSWTETVSLYLHDKDNFLNDTFNTIIKIICSLCILLISSIFVLFQVLVNDKFDQAYNLIPILILSSIFSMLSANLSAIYISLKKTKEIAVSTIICAFLNLLTHLLLINKIGLFAASLSTLISFFLLFIIRFFNIRKYVFITIHHNILFQYGALFMICTICYYINNFYLNIINLVFMFLLLCIINKSELRNILEFIKEKLKKRSI